MRFTVIFFFLFLSKFGLFSQPSSKIDFKRITSGHGLSHNSVTTIYEDKNGFIWIGTKYGLNTYKAASFKVYKHDNKNPFSISNNWIRSIAEDSMGNLWVGTKYGLNLYIEEEDRFIQVIDQSKGNKKAKNDIREIKIKDRNHLYIATSYGLRIINTETKFQKEALFNYNEKTVVNNAAINSFLISKKGNFWFSYSNSVEVFDSHFNNIYSLRYSDSTTEKKPKQTYTCIFEDNNNNIWLGTEEGLFIFNKDIEKFQHYFIDKKKAIKDPVRTFCQDSNNVIWVGSYKGLYRLNTKKDEIDLHQHSIINSKSLSQNSIYKIIKDSNGSLWIGTWAGGVNYLNKKINLFYSNTVGSDNKHLNYKVVSSFIESKKELLIGTEGGGINIFDKENNSFSYFINDPDDPKSLSRNNVKDMIEDHQGNLWVALHEGGIDVIRKNKNGLTVLDNFNKKRSKPLNLSSDRITCLFEDEDYNVWIGTDEGIINYYDFKSKTIGRIKNEDEEQSNSVILSINKALKKNTIYVGKENGLFEVNTKTKKINSINFRGAKKEKYVYNLVTSILQISENSLWIGTEGDGLYEYDPISKKSRRFGKPQGLPSELIYGILYDKENIWVSTNKGISRINTISNTVNNFDESDGLQANEFNYQAYLKTRNNDLIFGGINGFTIFNPSEIKVNKSSTPVKLTTLHIRDKTFFNITESRTGITLKYNQNDLVLNYVGLDYAQPQKINYKYKLEGFDKDWLFVGNQNKATYTNIDPGNYTFKVKATNPDGIWNTDEVSLKVTINPPLWKTWWAYCLYVILLTTSVFYIRKYNALRIEDKNKLKKERLEKEKIEELNKLKLQLFTNISHDFRTPLTLIISPLNKLISKKNINKEVKEKLTMINKNANILLQLANQLLDFRKTDSGKLKLSYSKQNLLEYAKEFQDLFQEFSKMKNIDFVVQSSSKNPNLWFDKIEIRKVMINILSNAFKYTPHNGKIKIEISDYDKEYIKIVISDTGIGIPKKYLDFIFDRYFQVGLKSEKTMGTGVGLALSKNIITLHKGEINVDSIENLGTSFTILLPKGKAHIPKEQIVKPNTEENDSLTIGDEISLPITNHDEEGDYEADITDFDETKETILLVEDNIQIRKELKEIFENNYNIFEAGNGKKGIEIAESKDIDIIISDVMMPEMSGIDMSNYLKNEIKTSHVPIILLTARSSDKIKKIGFKTGADAFIVKPFNSDIVQLQVHNFLETKRRTITNFKKDVILESKELKLESLDDVFLKNAIDFIEENLENEDFNVTYFTDKMNMSQSVLYRKIKALTGQSISEFIRSIRIKRAARLLIETKLNINSIAYKIGFNDIKYFRTCFKNTFNTTPSQYRKNRDNATD